MYFVLCYNCFSQETIRVYCFKEVVMYRRVVSKSSRHNQLLFLRLSYVCKSNYLLIIIPQAMGQVI